MSKEIDQMIEPSTNRLSYLNYLKINELTSLQDVLSTPPEHDEMLFIIIHQAYELWFKQILHETEQIRSLLQKQQGLAVLKSIKRIHVIQDILIHQVDILETMTPNDFSRFRERLNPASGFQSLQFRVFEFNLGLKDPAYLKFFRHLNEATQELEKALARPSLYDDVLHFLSKSSYKIPKEVLERDVSQAHQSNEALTKIFVEIYQRPMEHYQAYMLLEALIDLDEKLEIWRYRHVAMVKRMIGTKTGTGGSTGAKYLSSTLAKRCFPEIWEVRNHLGSY